MTDQLPDSAVVRTAQAWLDDGPSRMPDRALEATLDKIHHTKQRRARWPAWELQQMKSPQRVALLTVVVLGIGLSATTLLSGRQGAPEPPSSPSAEPPPSPSAPLPPPLTERFDSRLNGISMNYPAGWQMRPATESWTDGVISFGASGVDVIFDPARRGDLYFAVASEPSGRRPDHDWGGDLPLQCPGGHEGSTRVLTFDGASGRVVTCGRSPVGIHSAFLVTETHGYVISLYVGEAGLIDTYTDTWFVSVLETLDLRATGAPAASGPASP